MENNAVQTSIHELLGEKFYIPNYQRGYRWTKFEVGKLVDDLYRYFQEESRNNEKSYYCLQPLVVKKRDDGSWELIDGQQRMTTVFLLLKCLISKMEEIERGQSTREPESKKEFEIILRGVKNAFPDNICNLFQLTYQTREGSWNFLNNIDKDNNPDCRYVDYVYIHNAYSEIKNYFIKNEITGRMQLKFLTNIVDSNNRVRFIWYDVTDKCNTKGNENYAKELFSRLNIGKIPLTNAELIKSLFLNDIYNQLRKAKSINENSYARDVIDQYYETLASQLEYRIAGEWDIVEQKLNDSEFWAFIYGKDDGKYSTRIELLFDLIVDKKPEEQDKYFTFSQYDNEFRAENDRPTTDLIDKNPDNLFSCREWRKVMNWFYTLCSWYEERDLYHYIGFLGYKKEPLRRIKKMYDEAANHSKFLNMLRNYVFRKAGVKNEDGSNNDIDDFVYPDDSGIIRDILLLFNIESIRKTKSEERFSFSSFYAQEYDIEHIKPQTPREFQTAEEWKGLLRSSLEYLTGCRYLDKNELSEILYEKALTAYTKSDECSSENCRRILILIEKRGSQNPYTVDGKKILHDIDIQLRQYAPEIKRKKKEEDDCQADFIMRLKDCKAIKEPDDSSQSRLVVRLFDKYRDICNGKSVEYDFSEDEKKLIGIEDESGPNTIGNLVLLDRGTNRSYKNASFIVKRYYIQQREENGVYIPRSTRDVFNKMYSKSVAEPMRWTEQDMKDYIEEIKRVLK